MKVDISKITVRKDRVLIRELSMQEVTGSGIKIPDTVKEDEAGSFGEVVGVGSDIEDLKAGDRVMFDQYAGHYAHMDGSKHRCVREESVSLILPKE